MLARPPVVRDGMTLLEVLLAMAIFLISLVALADLVDTGAKIGVRSSMQSTGTRLAQSKLAEVEAGAISLTGGGESGEFPAEPGWNYTVESSAAGPANVYAVTATCWRDYNGQRHEVKLSQMVCDPAVMGTAAAASAPTATTGTGGTP